MENVIEKLRNKILLHEQEIEKSLISIKKINEKVKRFDIEIFIINERGDIGLRLFSMDDNYNEVFEKNEDEFSGSKNLFEASYIKTVEIGEVEDIEDGLFEKEVLNILTEIIKKYINHINIPVGLYYHDTDNGCELK